MALRPASSSANLGTSSGLELGGDFSDLLQGVEAFLYRVACDGAHTLLFATPGITAVTGFPASQFVKGNRALIDLVVSEHRAALSVELDAAIVSGEHYCVRYPIETAEGTTRWVRDEGRIERTPEGKAVARSGLIVDIADEREREDSLKKALLLLDVLMDTTPDHIYFKDLESRFLRISAALAKWLESTPEDAVGKSDFDFFGEDHATRALADEQGIIRTGKPVIDMEEQENWNDGRIAWVSTTKMPLHDANGTLIGTFGTSRDITKRKVAEQAVEENQRRMTSIIVAQRDAAAEHGDAEAVLVMIAGRAQDVTGADGAALLLLDGDHLVVRTASGILEEASGKRVDPRESALEGWLADGLPRRFGDAQARPEIAAAVIGVDAARSLALAPIRHDQRVVGFLEVVGREAAMFQPHDEESLELLSVVVTAALGQEKLRQHAEESQYQALHDALTGLPNRVLFQDRLSQAILTAGREGERVGVLLLDLDRFKEINDTLGHAAGDRVLEETARRLHASVRASDTVARLGGDEFGLLLPKQTEPHELVHLLDKISTALEQPIDLDGLPLSIEGSIGVAFFPDHGTGEEELMRRADIAMYSAKQANVSHAFYEAEDDHHDVLQLTLIGDLRKAIDERQLVLYYQPRVSFQDGSLRSVEALLRWIHPERGLIPPGDFIPQAEETGLMKPLTQYVIDEALRQIQEWQTSGLELAVSVNVATRNLIDAAFPDDVAAALERWDVDPHLLEIEITESTMLDDPARTKMVLERLNAMGIRLSIDDFGTGYSSLAYLRQLPVDEIKIDRSFVMHMEENEDDAVIVRTTIDLGRNLGLSVTAEGVETDSTWHTLSELGCDIAQGFLLSKPIPAADLQAWITDRDSASEHADETPSAS